MRSAVVEAMPEIDLRGGAEQRVLLARVGWSLYRSIAESIGDRAVPRLTYVDGDLELMAPSYLHELLADRLRYFVLALVRGLNLTVVSAGSALWERADLDKGKKPDACFYVANEPLVREVDEIDLEVHPPPDLAVEIEISCRLVDGLSVYSALRVPEVWTFDGKKLEFLVLDNRLIYRESARSRAFAQLTAAEAQDWLVRAHRRELTEWLTAVDSWVRDDLARRVEGA